MRTHTHTHTHTHTETQQSVFLSQAFSHTQTGFPNSASLVVFPGAELSIKTDSLFFFFIFLTSSHFFVWEKLKLKIYKLKLTNYSQQALSVLCSAIFSLFFSFSILHHPPSLSFFLSFSLSLPCLFVPSSSLSSLFIWQRWNSNDLMGKPSFGLLNIVSCGWFKSEEKVLRYFYTFKTVCLRRPTFWCFDFVLLKYTP